jgi:hypothetical protein
MRHLARFAIAALLALSAPAAGVAATRVGVTSAVNPNATGRVPALETRVLHVGLDTFADERITTGPSGQVQLLFLDGASLSVGPGAEITIDRFVYDARGRLGELKLAATRGVLRFVGGAISKASTVEIVTPNASVGIRGGIVLVNVQPGTPLVATFLYGARMTVSAAGETQTVSRPGYSVTVAPGQAPSAPAPLPASELKAQLASLHGAKPADRPSGVEAIQDAALVRANVPAATGSTLRAAPLAAVSMVNSKATERAQQTAALIVQHASHQARLSVEFNRFLSILDYLDGDLRALPRVNSNGIFDTRPLFGYVGGVMDTVSSSGQASAASITPGSQAVLFLDAAHYRVVGDFFVSTADCCFDFAFGGEGRDNRGRSIFLAQNILAARNSASNPSVFAAPGSSRVRLGARAVMVSADALKTAVPGATPCECRFMTWGFWVGTYQQPNGRVDAINLGSWVVGRLPDLFEVPQSGVATYSGQAVGNVVTPGGAHYLAGGSYQLAWDFARRAGSTTIANFDGLTLQGTGASANGRDYAGTLSGRAAGSSFNGSLAGSFFKSARDAVAGTGGNFAFASATGYRAGGTFLARR